MAKPNYRHAKKQKEAARKARQDAKQQRRANAPETETESESESDAATVPEVPSPTVDVKTEA